MGLFITSVILVLTISFFCSLAEAVILSANISTPVSDPEKPGDKKLADTWKKLRRNISKPIAAILIFNTIANTGGSVVAGSAFSRIFGYENLWIFTLLMTFSILFGTEIMPKIIGVEYNKFLLRRLIRPLDILTDVFAPVIWLTELCAKPFKRAQNARDPVVTGADILAYASVARAKKNIDLEQESIIVNAIRLKHETVRKVMIPREAIQYIINGTSLEENEERFGGVLEKTRYPVCSKDDIDTILGTINHKKFEHKHGDQATDFTLMTREPVYVNEDISLLQALKMMRWNKRHMLFVRNSENKLTGLITLEDIMDELVDVALPD